MTGVQTVENSKPAASQPSNITILPLKTALAYLTRSLKTKTGDAPSHINRIIRALYAPLIAFDKDFPGHLAEIVESADRLPRGWTAGRYGQAIRAMILTLRHELVKERAENRPDRKRDIAPPESIADILAGMTTHSEAP